jgi:hypothetical protein
MTKKAKGTNPQEQLAMATASDQSGAISIDTPLLFKISSIADTGLKVLPKAIVNEGGYVKITATVNGVDQTISIEERTVPASFDIHWAKIQASIINKLDCPDFVDQRNAALKRLSIAYGKNRSITCLFLVPREMFMDPIEIKVPKLAWYSQSQLEDMGDSDPEDMAASTLTLEEGNILDNIVSDTKEIFQRYLTYINVLETVDSRTIEELAEDIRYRRQSLEVVSFPMSEPD